MSALPPTVSITRVDRLLLRPGAQRLGAVAIGVEDVGGTEQARGLGLVLVAGGDGDIRGAGVGGVEDGHEADRPGAEDDDALASSGARGVELGGDAVAVDGDGERFGEGGDGEVEVTGDGEEVACRDGEGLAHAAGPGDPEELPVDLAEFGAAAPALRAFAAVGAGLERDAIADTEGGHALAERRHLSGDLVAENAAGGPPGRLAVGVQIGAADAGGADAEDDLAGAGGLVGELADLEDGGIVGGDGSSHAGSFAGDRVARSWHEGSRVDGAWPGCQMIAHESGARDREPGIGSEGPETRAKAFRISSRAASGG